MGTSERPFGPEGEGAIMKICICSTGKSMVAEIDGRFGKAPVFLIIDTETMDHEFIENAGRMGPKSGLSAARVMLEKGVEAVLSGCVGQNAKAALKLGNIRVYEDLREGETLGEVVEKFKRGEYRESTESEG